MVCWDMAHISGDDRLDAFVDGLHLERAGFERVQANRTGRPGYDPADLLKLHLYGYVSRIRSSRRLEAKTHRGTRIKAVNNVNRNFTRAKLERELKSAEERLERYLRQMDEADADDAGGGPVVDLEGKIAGSVNAARP